MGEDAAGRGNRAARLGLNSDKQESFQPIRQRDFFSYVQSEKGRGALFNIPPI